MNFDPLNSGSMSLYATVWGTRIWQIDCELSLTLPSGVAPAILDFSLLSVDMPPPCQPLDLMPYLVFDFFIPLRAGLQTKTAYFDFTEDTGLIVSVNMKTLHVAHSTASDLFFMGFENFVYLPNNTLKGVSGTVTESGLCDDGCFQFGVLKTLTGVYLPLENVLFKYE